MDEMIESMDRMNGGCMNGYEWMYMNEFVIIFPE